MHPDGFTERRVDVGDVSTRYWEMGEGDPIILIHGGGAGADGYGNWKTCAPLLAPAGRVLAIDMLGFGGSLAPDPDFEYSQDRRTEHLLGFMDALELTEASLVGNSMGGVTALGVAMREPDRVAKLVLMGSGGFVKGPPSPALRPIAEYQEPSLEGMRQIIRALTHDNFPVDEDLVRYRYDLTCDEHLLAAYRSSQDWIQKVGGLFYEEDQISAVKTLTLVVQGRDDKVVPLEHGYRFGELLDNSWLHVIPHCGHWAMIEHPKHFCGITKYFLEEGVISDRARG